MALCALCKTIPPNLFSFRKDEQCSLAHHNNVPALEASARAGCPMCTVIMGALHRRVQADGQIHNIFGQAVDSSKEVQLRSIKLGRQHVCVGWSDTGNLRGIEIPPDWDDKSVTGSVLDYPKALTPQREANMLRWWLNNCWTNHVECAKGYDASYIPTRLVDVLSNDSKTARLVATVGISMEDKRYVAASHCWGLNMPASAKTVKASLTQHMNCIRLDDLSKTFIDLIEITRNIGVRYVWIDSLCIIQDSRDDWETEAAQMAAVYSNAYVTIAASSSANGQGGCRLGERDIDTCLGPADLAWEQPSEEPGRSVTRRIRVFAQPDVELVNVLQTDPLVQRGWTLQERELSPRVAHYSKDTIRWECASMKATLEFPWQDKLPFNDTLRTFDVGQLHPQGPNLRYYDDTTIQKNCLVWLGVVERYSKRHLTHQSDVLPAISGIAKYFAEATGDEHHAGLFASHMPMALTWKVQGEWKKEIEKSDRPKEYLAPSWSWASIRGPVFWLHKHADKVPIDHAFTPEILNISTVPAGEDPFGALKSGVLRMKGLLTPAVAMRRESNNLAADERSVLVGGQVKVGTMVLDVPTEDHSLIICFALRRESEYGWTDALALVPVGELDAGMRFKRVGLVRSQDKSWWDKAMTVEISVI